MNDQHDKKLDALLDAVELPAPSPALLQRTREAVADVLDANESAGHNDQVITPDELAAMLSVDVETVMANLAELPAFEFAGQIRFSRAAIDQWVRDRTSAFSMNMASHSAARLKIG